MKGWNLRRGDLLDESTMRYGIKSLLESGTKTGQGHTDQWLGYLSDCQLALDEPDRSPREIAVMFTDRKRSFVSEASVYRLLKARGLVTSPAFIVMKAADKFANPTTAPRSSSRRRTRSTGAMPGIFAIRACTCGRW